MRYIVINTWNYLLKRLKKDLPEQAFNTWIRPLQGTQEKNVLCLLAPNAHVLNWVKSEYSEKLHDYLSDIDHEENLSIKFEIGSTTQESLSLAPQNQINEHAPKSASYLSKPNESKSKQGSINTNKDFNFTSFVEGKSNQLARAAGIQVGENPGLAYNPLFIYGGVGLGKTHLMHAVGNMIKDGDEQADVLYMHSENFVASMVKALQHGTIDDFKRKMRNVNALLIDDVQFFAGKERSQEEFFHTFNALFESRQQIILTSDRFPKEVEGLEDRLKSRFGWGLTVAIEPPDLETRVAILMNKSKQLCEVELSTDVAFFIAKNVRSNIRELEGALRRINANAKFTGETVNVEFAKEALRDMIDAQAKLVTLENIQKTVSEYFKIRISDMRSNKRSRTIARPRQIAMALAKDLTNHSLPEIGEAFGGRDHTTVLYATRKVSELRDADPRISEDYNNLLRTLNN